MSCHICDALNARGVKEPKVRAVAHQIIELNLMISNICNHAESEGIALLDEDVMDELIDDVFDLAGMGEADRVVN